MPTDTKSGWIYLDDFNWVHRTYGAVRKSRTYQANRFEYWAMVDEMKPEGKVGPFEKRLAAMEFLVLVADFQAKVLESSARLNAEILKSKPANLPRYLLRLVESINSN